MGRQTKKIIALIVSLAGLVLFTLLFLFAVDSYIVRQAEGFLYDEASEVPERRVGLLLGTSKFIGGSTAPNLFYAYRIDAAVELYEAEKIEFLLISGDNSRVEYNEPETMRDDLIARGVPEEKIFLDYAGFRTWDSVVRAKEVFGLDSFVVISQQFHNERALYAARANDLDVIGFNAQAVPISVSPKTWVRERLARAQVLVDDLVNRDPKFLGEPVVIE